MKVVLALLLGTITVFGNHVKEKQTRISYKGHKLISVKALTHQEVEFLRKLQQNHELNLDFWKEPMIGEVDIHVDPKEYDMFTQTLKKHGMTFTMIEDDLQKLIDAEKDSFSQEGGPADYTKKYLYLKEIEAFLDQLEKDFPERVEKFDLGVTTYEGRPIMGVKVSTNLLGSGKSAIWMEAGAHAREFIAISVALGTLDKLARLYNDSGNEGMKATHMLDLYDWYIVPVLNPDGYDYAYNVDRLWNKNRQRNSQRCYGVDLNRNWNADFGGKGSSRNPCSNKYIGKKALDQPETAALDTFVKNTNGATAFISLHSYGQLIHFPWGYKTEQQADYDYMRSITLYAKQELESHYGTQYDIGSTADMLGISSGNSMDHMLLNNGIKYVFGYALKPRDAQSGGFLLPVSEISKTIDETFASIWEMSDHIYLYG